METTRIALLGSFTLKDPPTIAATKLNSKEKAVFAYLAVNCNKQISRETLRRLLWADAHERNGRHSVTQALYVLSKAFPSWVFTSPAHATLRFDSAQIDVHRARNLASENVGKLSELLSGDLLADVHTREEAFEEWKDLANADFHRFVEVKAVEALIGASRVAPREAHGHALVLASRCPHFTLIRDLERRLHANLDATNTHRSQADTPMASDKTTIPFIGRTLELMELHKQWEKAEHREGSLTIISGAPGEGKTRLTSQFAGSIQRGRVIHVRCYEPEMHIALNVIADLMQELISETTLAQLPAVYAAALSEVLPTGVLRVDPLPTLGQVGAQRRLFEALNRAIVLESQRKTLLITIDDLHWADDSSLAFLHFISRRLRNVPVMVVGTTRPSKRSRRIIAASHSHIAIRELAIEDLRTIADQALKLDRTATPERLIKLTGGNAFLLSEYLKYLDAKRFEAPTVTPAMTDISSFVREVIESLPLAARQIVRGLAALGRPAERETLQQMSELDISVFSHALDHLRSARIIVGDDAQVWFRHDLIRERVYKAIPPAYRRLLHSRIADVLLRSGGTDDAIALQSFYSGDMATAFKFALLAAEAAEKRASISENAYFLTLAIKAASDKAVRLSLRFELAIKLYRAGRYQDAIKNGQIAIRGKSYLGTRERAILALRELDTMVTLGKLHSRDIASRLDSLEREFGEVLTGQLRYDKLRVRIRAFMIDGDRAACATHTKELADIARTLPGDHASLGLSFAARVEAFVSQTTRALIWANEAEESLQMSDYEAVAGSLGNVAAVLYLAGEYQRALTLNDRSLRLINECGAMHLWARTAADKLPILLDLGRFDDVRHLAAEIVANSTDDDTSQYVTIAHLNVALMYYYVGELDQAKQHAQAALQTALAGLWPHHITTRALMGTIELDLGHLSAADSHAHQLEVDLRSDITLLGDRSVVEIFRARWNSRHGKIRAAIEALEAATQEDQAPDIGGRMRMLLELARLLRRSDPKRAKGIALELKNKASGIGLVSVHDGASSLLAKL